MANKTKKGTDTRTWWEKHADAVITGVCVLGIAGLGNMIMDLTGLVAGNSTRIVSTEQRMDRIARTLPNLGAKIAEEQVFKNYGFAVIQTSNIVDSDKSSVYVMDAKQGVVQTWVSPNYRVDWDHLTFAAAVAGIIKMTDDEIQSFSELQKASHQMSQLVMVPKGIKSSDSYLVDGEANELRARLVSIGWKQMAVIPFAKLGISTLKKSSTYPDYVLALEKSLKSLE